MLTRAIYLGLFTSLERHRVLFDSCKSREIFKDRKNFTSSPFPNARLRKRPAGSPQLVRSSRRYLRNIIVTLTEARASVKINKCNSSTRTRCSLAALNINIIGRPRDNVAIFVCLDTKALRDATRSSVIRRVSQPLNGAK